MADYYPLLARAVAALPNSSRETRSAIYERARKALLGQLQTIDPPVSQAHIDAESKALDDAIARLESELAQEAGKTEAPAPAPAPAPGAPAGLRQPPPPPAPTARPIPPASPPTPPLRPAPGAPPRPAGPGASAPPPPATRPGPPPLRPAQPPIPGGPAAQAERVVPSAEGRTEPDAAAARTDEAPAEAASPARARPREEEREGPPPVPAKLPGARGEPARPAAPTRPETGRVVSRQMLIWIPLILLIGGGIGFAAWRLRVPQEEFAKPRASVAETRQPQGSAKINERADGSAAPSTPAPQPQQPARAPQQPAPAPAPAPQPQAQAQAEQPAPRAPVAEQAAPVAQRAAFLLQAAVNDQQNVETHIGSVVWRTEESRRPNANGSPALRADVDIAAVGLRLVFLIEKNNDPTLRASHMLTFRFLPQEGSPLPGIAEMGSPQMRNESAPAVEPLAGAQAKITDNIYIVALSSDPTFAARNLETLRSRGWFDFPIRLNDGRIAKITIEKGAPGERLLGQVIDQWQR